jgi:hypothetical protein
MSHFPICLSHCEEHHHSQMTNSNSQPHLQAVFGWWSELLLSQSWTQRIGQESPRDVHYLCISPALGPGQVSADTNMHSSLAGHAQSRWWWLSVQGPLMLREAESAHRRPESLQERRVEEGYYCPFLCLVALKLRVSPRSMSCESWAWVLLGCSPVYRVRRGIKRWILAMLEDYRAVSPDNSQHSWAPPGLPYPFLGPLWQWVLSIYANLPLPCSSTLRISREHYSRKR